MTAGVREALTWPSPSLPGQPRLTGFPHGAAGIGHALLELHRATGNRRFRADAEEAFGYERGLCNADARNWPDLRENATPGTPLDGGPSYTLQWCHGAPGMALSRLGTAELLGDPQIRSKAITALETTRDAASAELHTGNYSLCHGLAATPGSSSKGNRSSAAKPTASRTPLPWPASRPTAIRDAPGPPACPAATPPAFSSASPEQRASISG